MGSQYWTPLGRQVCRPRPQSVFKALGVSLSLSLSIQGIVCLSHSISLFCHHRIQCPPEAGFVDFLQLAGLNYVEFSHPQLSHITLRSVLREGWVFGGQSVPPHLDLPPLFPGISLLQWFDLICQHTCAYLPLYHFLCPSCPLLLALSLLASFVCLFTLADFVFLSRVAKAAQTLSG